MTNGIVAPTLTQSNPVQQTTRIQEVAAQKTESFDLSYNDGNGNAFNLSVSRDTSYYSLTYDRSAQMRNANQETTGANRQEGARGRGGWAKEINETEKLLRDSGFEVKNFKRLMHRMLKAVDAGYRERYSQYDPIEEEATADLQLHAQYEVTEEKLSISMDRVDTEYWSVENTAQRLADFAVGLYAGGDRTEHYEKMLRGMEQGYQEAADAFGGALPDIARDTLDLAADILAEWVEQSQSPEMTTGVERVA